MERPSVLLDLDIRIRKLLLILLTMAIIAGAFAFLYIARPAIQFTLTILSPFMVALIVAYIFNPIISYLQRRFRLGRIGGVLIAYTIILILTTTFFAVLLPVIYTQLRDGLENLISNFPTYADRALSWLKLRMSPQELDQLKTFLRQHVDLEGLSDQAGPAVGRVAMHAVDTGKILTGVVVTAVSLTLGFFAFVSFVVVITFYFLLDYHRMEYVARVLLPDDRESRVFDLWRRIDLALGGFLRGQLIVAFVVGVLYTIALMALGMKKYAILVGFLAGFGNLIPYLGPIVGGAPAVLWILFGERFDSGEGKMIGLGIVLLLTIAIQSLDGFYMQPRIVGKNAGLHPLLVLLALLIGAQFGLGGMIIAVPAAIMAKGVLKELWWDPLVAMEEESKREAAEP